MAEQPSGGQYGAIDQYLRQMAERMKKLGGNTSSVFGTDYLGNFVHDADYRARFYPQNGESRAAWANRLDKEFPGAADMLGMPEASYDHTGSPVHQTQQTRMKQTVKMLQDPNVPEELKAPFKGLMGSPDEINKLIDEGLFADDKNLGGRETRAGGPQEDQQSGEAKLRAFADRMMGPLDMNDPKVQRIQSLASSSASQAARNRGIEGGLSVAGIGDSVSRATLDLEQQRHGLGLNALQGAEGISMQKAQLAEQQAQSEWQARQAQMQQSYQNRSGLASGIGSAIGAGLGAIASIPSGGAMAPALMGAGASIGGGLGGLTQGGPTSLPYYGSRGMTGKKGGYYGGGY